MNGINNADHSSATEQSGIDTKEHKMTDEKMQEPESAERKINGTYKDDITQDSNEDETGTDIEMDEEKLLNDDESVDSPSINEDSLLNSDNDDSILEDEKESNPNIPNGNNKVGETEENNENDKIPSKNENDESINGTNVGDENTENTVEEKSIKTKPESSLEVESETGAKTNDNNVVNSANKCKEGEDNVNDIKTNDKTDNKFVIDKTDVKQEFESNDENLPPAEDVSETEEERRANRLKVQFDRVELLKDELRSEEATLTLLRKLFDSQRGRNGYKSSSKPQPSQISSNVHSKPAPQPTMKSSIPPKQPPPQQKPPPPHNNTQPVQKYYIQVGNQLVPAPPPSNGNSNTVYQYANGSTSHSYQPPAPPKPAPPPKQTPEQKKNAAKAALRRQLEQTLLQIPPPRPPPADWKAVPNVNSMDFMMLVGLDEVVDTILDMDNKPTLKKALENLSPYNPRICSQCKVDFSPCWKAAKNNNMDAYVLCERCALQNVKKELKAEHTSRLKAAFMKALKQEQEIEEKIKAGEEVNIAGITGSEKQESQPSNHSPNPPQHQPSSNRNSSPKLAIAVPPPAQSSANHAPSPPERHHQPSSGHHRHHQVVQHYPHHTSLVQQLHHQHIQQQQLELEPSSRHSSRWHPYMSSSSNHHRDHHPVHHRSYVPGSSTNEGSPRQEYYVVHHPHQNVRYVTR